MSRTSHVTETISPVDSDVQTHQLDESLVLSESEEVGQVVRVILGSVDGGQLARAVQVAVDSASDVRELGDAKRGVNS